jgi:hypothetical protein
MTAELPQMSAPATITRAFLNFEFMDASNHEDYEDYEDNVAFGSFTP